MHSSGVAGYNQMISEPYTPLKTVRSSAFRTIITPNPHSENPHAEYPREIPIVNPSNNRLESTF